jgi:hypothetical protein
MSRGPLPRRALDAALPVARQRGTVRQAERGPELLYDFTILGVAPIAFVRVKYAARIRAALPEIVACFQEEISLIRLITHDAAISRELWLCSKHGTLRFFRVTNDGLIELGRDGKVLQDPQIAAPAP